MHVTLITIGAFLLAIAGAIAGSPGRVPEDHAWFQTMLNNPDTSTARWIYPAVFAVCGAVLIAVAVFVV